MNTTSNYFKLLLKTIKTKENLLIFTLLGGLLFTVKLYSNTINLYLLLLIISTIIFQKLLLQKNNYALFLIRSFFIICMLFEIICGVLIHYDPIKSLKPIKNNDDNFEMNKIMGYSLRPNLNAFRSIKSIGKDTLYNVLYASDKYSRRVSKNNKDSNLAQKHALFLGCSITFGEGINYKSTFPYLFEKNNSAYNAYNYGFSG